MGRIDSFIMIFFVGYGGGGGGGTYKIAFLVGVFMQSYLQGATVATAVVVRRELFSC
jgi:hypothetical protein